MDLNKKPLGYISLLNNTQKAIYPMDDFFINYAFYKKENWGHLRNILNIFLDAYAVKYDKKDGFHFVDENIVVETQYEHYLKNTTKQQTQDIKIDEIRNSDQTYIEFQNKTTSKPPIAIRASNYNGLAINKAKDDTKTSQIWLLGENDDNVLRGQAISNFRMREENTGEYYPRDVNIMFVSLPRLAEEIGICGELARLLMGSDSTEISDELKPIIGMFKHEYEVFKENEEVIQSMTVIEERFVAGKEEGREEGIALGESKGAEKMIRFAIASGGMSDANINKIATQAGISMERIAQIRQEVLGEASPEQSGYTSVLKAIEADKSSTKPAGIAKDSVNKSKNQQEY